MNTTPYMVNCQFLANRVTLNSEACGQKRPVFFGEFIADIASTKIVFNTTCVHQARRSKSVLYAGEYAIGEHMHAFALTSKPHIQLQSTVLTTTTTTTIAKVWGLWPGVPNSSQGQATQVCL